MFVTVQLQESYNKIVRRSIAGELMTLPRSRQAVVLIAEHSYNEAEHALAGWRLSRVPENSFRDVTVCQMAVNADLSTESQWPGPSDDELLAFLPLHATFLKPFADNK